MSEVSGGRLIKKSKTIIEELALNTIVPRRQAGAWLANKSSVTGFSLGPPP